MDVLLTKEFLGAFGAYAITLALLIVWLRERGTEKAALLVDLKAERDRNEKLQEKFLVSINDRATAGTQVGVAFAAATDKMADRVGGVETKLELLAGKVEMSCKAPR